MKRVLIVMAALMLAACQPKPSSILPDMAAGDTYVRPGPTQTAEKACATKGGELMRVGRLQTQQCVIPFADGGKVCRDGDDCQGTCYTETAGTQPPGPVTGRCAVNDLPFGCRTPVEDGQAGPTLCVD